MNKYFILSLALSASCVHNAWSMEENDKIVNNDNNQSDIIQQQIEVNTMFNAFGENTINVGYKIFRKVQKNVGYLSVASESKEELQSRLDDFSKIANLEQLSVDAKNGGFMSKAPSLFKQINDRVHENNRQAQTTLVEMFDKKSLDVGQLNLSKQYIDNSKAYSTALYKVLDSAYNEKFTEIQKNINPQNNTESNTVEGQKNDKEDK